MSDWQIELAGDEKDIELLERYLIDTPYHVSTVGSRRFLTLPEIPPSADSETVHAASSKLIDIINGAAKLHYGIFGGVSFVKVLRADEHGKRVGFGYFTLPDLDDPLIGDNSENQSILSWVELALSNQEVERALYLFGSLELNWKNLYLVLEVIEDSFGGEAPLLDTGLISLEDIKLFKRTANSYKAIGRDARHGALKFEPPRKSMTLKNAQKLMRTLLTVWIKYKMSKSA